MIPKDFSQYNKDCCSFLDKWLFMSMSHAFAMEIAEEYNGKLADSVEIHIFSQYSEKPLQIIVEGAHRMNVVLNNKFISRIGRDKLSFLISVFRATGSVPPELWFA